ncbi:MAG: glycogen synthase GlgA [Candidatus Omnitrophota bacterium]
MSKKFPIAFLWHMHQPMYKDLVTDRYYLPWVRLHATYSYLDMAAILYDFPNIKCTCNLTPSLIWQLLDVSSDRPINDTYLELTERQAQDLTDEDKCFLLKNFFSCDPSNAIDPLKKYKELFARRGDSLAEEYLLRKSKEYTVQDYRDLQMFFNLAWCGFTLKKKDKLIKELLSKASGYSEDDKTAFLKRQKEAVALVLPAYKKLQEEGRIEISTSPFYHPILPLLCRGKDQEGFDFSQDAKVHVEKAIALYKKVFGRAPVSMWPPEGSVSQDIIPFLADRGIKWIATDEGILLESFKGQDLSRDELIYKAFTAKEDSRKIDIVFRDINISNAISFRYSRMPAKKAAADLLKDFRGIAACCNARGGEHLASVILDGENPWPYYPGGGEVFLRAVYKGLSQDAGLETVTIGEYLDSHKERKDIPKLYSGSWIDRNFKKWIGSPQKNTAWEYLRKARRELFNMDHQKEDALEELYVAEGSDWFWWYDDFGTELNFIFDEIFRRHLLNIYNMIGRPAPYGLSEPIPAHGSIRTLPEGPSKGEMARQKRILFVASESVPFAKTGGLADVAGSLPKALAAQGLDIRVMMPLYKCVSELKDIELIKEVSIKKEDLPGDMNGFEVYSARTDGVTTYFIDNKKLFDRSGLYGTSKGEYPDSGIRFSFFSRAVLAAVKKLDFKPDVIHCNDWQTALIPFYLRFRLEKDNFFNGIKTLFTIHNMAYQGAFKRNIMSKIDIPERFFNMDDLEFYGQICFMKSGILYSDAVSTVSRKYAEEIMTAAYGSGLDGLVRKRKNSLYGIPNGVDYSVWNPKKDKFIKTNYDAESIEKKDKCKEDLIKYAGLNISKDTPLLGSVTRLAEQKGMDLLAAIAPRLVEMGAGLVVLGHGSENYNRMFRSLADKFPGKIYVCNAFNDELAHKIEAGSDMFIMPSRYEPCGLNQMYSLKYGTIPIVRATGGLDDAVIDVYEDRKNGNGFKFVPAEANALYETIEKAVQVYKNKDEWMRIVKRAMAADFSWDHSAEEYVKLYRDMCGG